MKISAVKCHICGDTVYSRSGYDYRTCTCGNIHVDNGIGVGRCNFHSRFFSSTFVYVDADRSDLQHDFRLNRNTYGIIAGKPEFVINKFHVLLSKISTYYRFRKRFYDVCKYLEVINFMNESKIQIKHCYISGIHYIKFTNKTNKFRELEFLFKSYFKDYTVMWE